MTGALFARDTHFNDGLTRLLGGERFIEQLNRDGGLLAQGGGKFGGATPGEIWLSFLIERLTDDNQPNLIFSGEGCHLRRIQPARNMPEDGQGAGKCRRRVAERETNPFFAVIHS